MWKRTFDSALVVLLTVVAMKVPPPTVSATIVLTCLLVIVSELILALSAYRNSWRYRIGVAANAILTGLAVYVLPRL
jgi:hypothetical protein